MHANLDLLILTCARSEQACSRLQGYLVHTKTPPLLGSRYSPRLRPTMGLKGKNFLMSEVPPVSTPAGRVLYPCVVGSSGPPDHPGIDARQSKFVSTLCTLWIKVCTVLVVPDQGTSCTVQWSLKLKNTRPSLTTLQGYLAHTETPWPRTLVQGCA